MIIPATFSRNNKEQWSGMSYYDFDGKCHAISNMDELIKMAKQIEPYYKYFEGSIKIVFTNVNKKQFYHFVDFISKELYDFDWLVHSNGNNCFTIYPIL
jgi:hypothetical protein